VTLDDMKFRKDDGQISNRNNLRKLRSNLEVDVTFFMGVIMVTIMIGS
jgi:hypothetical protein